MRDERYRIILASLAVLLALDCTTADSPPRRTAASRSAVLYRFNTGGPIGGGVISYAVDRKQYVAVMSGRPSRFAVGRDPGAPTVLVFGLP